MKRGIMVLVCLCLFFGLQTNCLFGDTDGVNESLEALRMKVLGVNEGEKGPNEGNYCTKCGKAFREEDQFCGKCGAAHGEQSKEKSEEGKNHQGSALKQGGMGKLTVELVFKNRGQHIGPRIHFANEYGEGLIVLSYAGKRGTGRIYRGSGVVKARSYKWFEAIWAYKLDSIGPYYNSSTRIEPQAPLEVYDDTEAVFECFIE